jgi:hypothetical protein
MDQGWISQRVAPSSMHVRHAIDTALLSIIGCINKAAFSASRGRAVFYRFCGRPGVLLTITGPAATVGATLVVGCLPDGDDYIVVATATEASLRIALRTAISATIELANQHIPVDIIMLTDETERAALLSRLLKRASIYERREVIQLGEVPIARLAPHYKPTSGGSVAVSGIWIP